MKKKRRVAKLTKIELALILLADYMEDPNHSDYKIKQHVLDILGLETLTPIQ